MKEARFYKHSVLTGLKRGFEERLYRCCRNTQAKTPYGAWGCEGPFFYTDTIPTGFRRGLESSRFLCKIRFGWETEPTGLGVSVESGSVGKPNLPAWG